MIDKTIKLKDVLKLIKNKRNYQYSFVLKKKAMIKHGLTPSYILNIPIISIIKYNKKEVKKCQEKRK